MPDRRVRLRVDNLRACRATVGTSREAQDRQVSYRLARSTVRAPTNLKHLLHRDRRNRFGWTKRSCRAREKEMK